MKKASHTYEIDSQFGVVDVIDCLYGIREICRSVSYSETDGGLVEPIDTRYILDALSFLANRLADELTATNER